MSGADTTKALRIAKVIELLNKKSPHGGLTLKEMGTIIVRPEKNTSIKEGLYRLDADYLPSISPEKALIIFLSLLHKKGSALAGHTNEIKDALIGTLFMYKYSPQSLPVEKLQERIYVVEEQLADQAKVGEIFAKLVQFFLDIRMNRTKCPNKSGI